MRLLILGATGRTGRRLVTLALARGHRVVALVRDPAKLGDLKVEVVEGTPYDPAAVARAMPGCDAVINVLNVSRRTDNPWSPLAAPPDMISRSCANALAAMASCGVRRYVAIGTVGAGESWGSLPLLLRLLVRSCNLRYAFVDHGAQEALLAKSGADYTVVRAPMLSDAPNGTGVLVVRPGEPMRSRLSRDTAAELLLSLAEGREHAREIVHASNRG